MRVDFQANDQQPDAAVLERNYASITRLGEHGFLVLGVPAKVMTELELKMQDYRSKAVMLCASKFVIILCKGDAADAEVSMAFQTHDAPVKSIWSKSMNCRRFDLDHDPECNNIVWGNTPKVELAVVKFLKWNLPGLSHV